MHFTATIAALALVSTLMASPIFRSGVYLDKRSITQSLYDDLVFYFQYSSSIEGAATNCSSPNGNTLVKVFDESLTDLAEAWIVRDDTRKEIVTVFRGTTTFEDYLSDLSIILVPFVSPGVSAPADAFVHLGVLTDWNSIASQALAIIKAQLAMHPDYNLVSTGHSLGGSLASLVAVSLKQNFNQELRMYTYGQPRTGNAGYAFFVNGLFGANAFRSTHTDDGVPTLIPRALGYRHHGIEYWQNPDPASPATVRQCATDGEDPTCSASIPFMGADAAHTLYYGIETGTAFCT